jgi:hypothetical protein
MKKVKAVEKPRKPPHRFIGLNSPSKIAQQDILKDLHGLYEKTDRDIWVVLPSMMFNKESRKLNQKLGLHKINKFGSRSSFFN